MIAPPGLGKWTVGKQLPRDLSQRPRASRSKRRRDALRACVRWCRGLSFSYIHCPDTSRSEDALVFTHIPHLAGRLEEIASESDGLRLICQDAHGFASSGSDGSDFAGATDG